ncbi:MAG TPA: DUF4331 domain-containing protein [Candidatus Peribacteria bacterium]|nr:DUF4331 domain-containing protein [Candidatus Peribacteria bacterium]
MLALSACALFLTASKGFASSHREAPMISQDPAADQTDLYAWMSSKDNIVFAGNYYPLSGAGAGPNYYRFGDGVVYAFHIDTNGDAMEDITYAFQFSTKVKNGSTFLFNTKPIASLADANVVQTWTAYKIMGKFTGKPAQWASKNIVATGTVATPVIGGKSQPDYAKLAKEAIKDLGAKGKFFAGPRDDSFFVDLNVFDLLNLGAGVDSLKGANVQSIVFELPVSSIVSKTDPVVGVWGATYRWQRSVIRGNGVVANNGNLTQVSRLGMPLVNEVVVPLAYKDYFNASHPHADADTKAYSDVVLKPELAGLFGAVLGLKAPTENRTDLVTVFLTGVPGLNQPKNVRAAEMLRLNTSIAPAATPNRLGVFGGDTAGFPNGRRLADDVTDIAIQAVAGKLVDGYKVDEKLGDGVNANDVEFMTSFPYMAAPHMMTK